QAGMIYRPYRERSGEKIKALIQKSLHCTGYDELSLASLSTGDHSNIQPLMMELAEQYKEQCISISLPSLRVGTLTPEMIKAIAETRKTGFTLAPEAGTERLRRVINKPVSDHDLMDCAKTIFDSGWNILKLYFMIGLPTETWEDLDGIIRLTNDLLNLGKRISKRHVQLNVSVSTFVPKPHTPFQWVTQATLVEIRKKQEYLEKGLKKRGITIKTHNSEASLLEGVFARGERALGMVIEEAVRLGCRFDGWTESFNFNKWRDAFQKYGLDISDYASRIFRREDQLPWSHILSGVTIEHLKSEYEHAFAAEITENCRINCSECGIECDAGGMASLGKSDSSDVQHEIGKTATLSYRQGIRTKGPRHSNLIRLKYTKVGRVRFLSHLDLMTVFQRAVMRTEIPILFSQGFNPHPKVAFGPALAVGMESEAEYLDMEIDAFGDTSKITNVLNTALPEGIRILEIRIIPPGTPSLSNSICRYIYEVDISSLYSNDVDTRIQMFLSQSSVIVERNGKRKDIRPAIESIALTRDSTSAKVDITIQEKQGITARPQDIIENLFGVGSTESSLFNIRRTAMYINDRGSIKSPLDIV
ncbi:MAG TPA: TIGR03936 family radical SAM-associated protein, partial [Nitrospirota bacterium]|nr:TIGR03936 family radical SAM-associated protein [Nitrospirota bacterium]